ncbi:MAG: S9 family peptidase [Betaproteobacteria bacterium]
MIRRHRPVRFALLLAAVLMLPAAGRPAAQSRPAISLDKLLSFPFPDNLIASPAGSRIAWTLNERGVRNIYVADAPDFVAHRITSFTEDDGQELTNLSFSPDGRTIVYVRGGDHGSNWPAEGNLMPDPTSSPIQQKMQVWAVSASGGAPALLGEGDAPVVSPRGDRVAFERDRKIWIAPLDGSKPAEAAFFARGTSRSPAWSPDGRTLAFVSDREDHSFIALFTSASEPLRYIAPTTSRDSDPVWSPDGRTIAFVRQPGRGGVPRSPLETQPAPWALWVGDVSTLGARQAWKSGTGEADSIPRVEGGVNLHWGSGDRLVFLSYQDGWPHLYSVPSGGGAATLLTPGQFMVEYVAMSRDRSSIVYNANTGRDATDVDRRHLFKVPVDHAAPIELTSGKGLEWMPVVTADGQWVAYIGADAQRPPLPAVIPVQGGASRQLAADRLPADFPANALVTPEPVVFRASDGLEIHGQLFKTADGPARRPAVVYVHGGPPRQMLLGWHYMEYYANDYATNQYLASRGFIVLSVNYRLGIGYGRAFHYPKHAGPRGASEYLDVLAGARYLQSRGDVDAARLGIWGGSYGGYLTALALGRNSDIFAAGVDIHGVHDWSMQGRGTPDLKAALAGDGITEADLREAARVSYESSPISAVKTWRSPVLLIQADDDRNVDFHQMVDLERRLDAQGVRVEEVVIPDDIHDFLLWRSWKTAATATTGYLERMLRPGS